MPAVLWCASCETFRDKYDGVRTYGRGEVIIGFVCGTCASR